jgi:hypothetical protein
MKMRKVGKNGRKVKAIALYFFAVFCLIFKIEKSAKNRRKVKVIALLSVVFCPFMKNDKSR